MRLCTRRRVIELISGGKITIENVGDPESLFLDDIRIGLRLRENLLEVLGPVDLEQVESIPYRGISLRNASLLPGKFYVGLSEEEFCLADDILGIIGTRSKYTRVGLEMAGSSVLIIPGFGSRIPTPFVFEISVAVEVRNLNPDERYAYLILYELLDGIKTTGNEYWNRFPLMLLKLT